MGVQPVVHGGAAPNYPGVESIRRFRRWLGLLGRVTVTLPFCLALLLVAPRSASAQATPTREPAQVTGQLSAPVQSGTVAGNERPCRGEEVAPTIPPPCGGDMPAPSAPPSTGNRIKQVQPLTSPPPPCKGESEPPPCAGGISAPPEPTPPLPQPCAGVMMPDPTTPPIDLSTPVVASGEVLLTEFARLAPDRLGRPITVRGILGAAKKAGVGGPHTVYYVFLNEPLDARGLSFGCRLQGPVDPALLNTPVIVEGTLVNLGSIENLDRLSPAPYGVEVRAVRAGPTAPVPGPSPR